MNTQAIKSSDITNTGTGPTWKEKYEFICLIKISSVSINVCITTVFLEKSSLAPGQYLLQHKNTSIQVSMIFGDYNIYFKCFNVYCIPTVFGNSCSMKGLLGDYRWRIDFVTPCT